MVALTGAIVFQLDIARDIAVRLLEPLKLEGLSAPDNGTVTFFYDDDRQILVMRLSSDDLSTLRAMLNSYLGLVSAAVRTARGPGTAPIKTK